MIDRRGFLKTSATAGAAVLIGTNLVSATVPDITLEEATVSGLQAAMASGQTTARKIAEGYLARIADIDKKLNSVIELNPDALTIADRCDAERKAGKVRGPLHGIPILLKDNIDTADRMTTTAGSYALEGSIPLRDSHVAQRLREA